MANKLALGLVIGGAVKAGSVEEEQTMVALIQAAGLASIVSDKRARAGLLAQIKYGSKIKQDMSDIKGAGDHVKIEKDAADARATSAAKWGSAAASMEASTSNSKREKPPPRLTKSPARSTPCWAASSSPQHLELT